VNDLSSEAERIKGPLAGDFFLASYAVEFEGRFVAYAKICPRAPEDVWHCAAHAKVAGSAQPTPESALDEVEQYAQQLLRNMHDMGFASRQPPRIVARGAAVAKFNAALAAAPSTW
jgi:hypothetical protein